MKTIDNYLLEQATTKPKIFYHGSPTKGIKVLEPRLDPRLNMKGVFLTHYIESAILFSLLSKRHKASMETVTKNGRVTKLIVRSKIPLNPTGYLYSIKDNPKIVERAPFRYVSKIDVKPFKEEVVRIQDIEHVLDFKRV